jgi:hypothetical protein
MQFICWLLYIVGVKNVYSFIRTQNLCSNDFKTVIVPLSSSDITYIAHTTVTRKRALCVDMKWTFSKSMGPNQDGVVGSQGELYYMNSRRAKLLAPKEALGPEKIIPLFPRNMVLDPLSEEYLGVYEMRYRQLLNDVGESKVFGHIYYSQENSKLALVGTLSKVKRIERLDDGGMYAIMVGIGTFYIKEIVGEKPYLKARVQIFYDYSEKNELLKVLEMKVLEEVRYSVKIMKILYPQNNYTMNDAILRYRPVIQTPNSRSVIMEDSSSENERKSKFSYGAMGMLKTDAVIKLLFLQQPIVEKRYTAMLKVLEESTAFLEGELRKKGIYTDKGLSELRSSLAHDLSDILPFKASSWYPHNFKNGEWTQAPVLFE